MDVVAVDEVGPMDYEFPRGVSQSTLLPPKVDALERTTVWSFPSRGAWAGHKGTYRGNWSPHVPRNLILRYSKRGSTVLDPMCGGGTTLIEARLLGRKAMGFDINPTAVLRSRNALQHLPLDSCTQPVEVGDARQLSTVATESVDLVCLHPPYANMIRYSHDVPGDLSLLDETTFFQELRAVADEMLRVLRPNGHCAVLMGDTRRKKHIVPLAFRALAAFLEVGFVLREHIIKIQHNTSSATLWPGTYDFLLLAHENLFVLRKPTAHEVDSLGLAKDP